MLLLQAGVHLEGWYYVLLLPLLSPLISCHCQMDVLHPPAFVARHYISQACCQSLFRIDHQRATSVISSSHQLSEHQINHQLITSFTSAHHINHHELVMSKSARHINSQRVTSIIGSSHQLSAHHINHMLVTSTNHQLITGCSSLHPPALVSHKSQLAAHH
jgi:hypothetical protein